MDSPVNFEKYAVALTPWYRIVTVRSIDRSIFGMERNGQVIGLGDFVHAQTDVVEGYFGIISLLSLFAILGRSSLPPDLATNTTTQHQPIR